MAKLYIAGYSDIGSTTRGSIAIPQEPANQEQSIDIGSSSVVSEAFGKDIRLAKLSADIDCVISVGTSPDATNSVRALRAGAETTIAVSPGLKVAVMASAGNVAGTNVDGVSSILAILKAATDVDATQKRLDDIGGKINDLNAATQASRAASEQAKADRADADGQMTKAKQAMDALASATAEVERQRADLASAVEAQKVSAKEANSALTQRSSDLDQRETDMVRRSRDLDKREADISNRSVALDQRSKDLDDRETSLMASKADYEARLAKLKALTA